MAEARLAAEAAVDEPDGIVGRLADQLWQAEVDRRPIEPITDSHDGLTIEDAYAVQTVNIERRVAAGRVIKGRKVGLTSRPMQQLLGVHEPDFGVLLDDMFVDDGTHVELPTLIQPRVEAEIAFVMARDLAGPGVTVTDVLTATAGVLPAIEIVDSRITEWRIRIVDTVADNASSGRLVIGGRITPVTAVDLRLTGMLFYRNGVPIDSGAGAAALGNPACCVAWLANKLGELGAGLRAGDVVLPGALHRMVPVRPGDVFTAEFARLGHVTVGFSGGDRS
ncbi:MAG TPA: 2-keto-4-pentenoate hydratase [Pseudonocardiaceae bacterium]